MAGTPHRVQRLPRAQRRAQLLEAAQVVFVEKGYHAAAMEDIADEAGVSKPVLYQHFPGKHDLYLALLDTQCDRLESLVLEAIESAADHKERVYAAIAAFFEFVGDEGQAFRLIFESDLTSDPEVRQRQRALESRVSDAISARVAADTGLPAELARLIGVTLVGTAQVSARAWLAHSPGIPQADAARAAGHLVWRGIGAFPTFATRRAAEEGGAPAVTAP